MIVATCAMDLSKILLQLYAQKKVLEEAIAALEKLDGSEKPSSAGKRRGRKSMGAAERLEVSRRIKQYWANRRKKK